MLDYFSIFAERVSHFQHVRGLVLAFLFNISNRYSYTLKELGATGNEDRDEIKDLILKKLLSQEQTPAVKYLLQCADWDEYACENH